MHPVEALEALYRSERSRLFTYALSLLADESAAEDVVQDVFRKLCQSPPVARDLRAFVYRSVRNRALDILRRRQRDRERACQNVSIYAMDEGAGWDGLLSEDEARRIDRALSTLRMEEREVIVLHIYSEMTFEEIAAAQEAPMGTVAGRYRRAIAKLRETLEGKVRQ